MALVRMIPQEVDPSTQSEAEKALFRRLQLVEDDDWLVGLHSLNLSEHTYKRVGEIDFLLLGRKGIFALEVKGGGVTLERGMWKFKNRWGRVTPKKASPFGQARTAMFSMQERLQEMLDRSLVDRTCFGYAVVFPDEEFELESVEWSPEMVLDRAQLDREGGVLRSLNRLASYWRNKPGARNRLLSDDDIQRYLDVLRPDYDVVPTLQKVLDAAELELAALTAKQYAALEAHRRNPRMIYEGGAGTGKTMLAAEVCRRRSLAGDRVLFTCHSPTIAAHVGRQPGLEKVTAVPVAALKEGAGPYDIVVVDEAQDVINLGTLNLLEGVLAGGFEDGRWLFFLDSNNQKGLVGSYEPDGMDYLQSFRPATFDLSDNCRNTATIVNEVTSRTGADVGVSTAGVGPEVRFLEARARKQAAKLLASELDRLEQEGVDANRIMLLSPQPLAESSFGQLPGRWKQRIDTVGGAAWAHRPRTRLGFATVADFKGLESPFVLLADVAVEPGQGETAPLYVGMTRARVGLVVVSVQDDNPRNEDHE